MLAWGENFIGCCHGLEKDLVLPTEIPTSPATGNVKVLAASDNHCFILSDDGCLYCFGMSCNGSLATSLSNTKMTAFEKLNIVDIFAGGKHMFAITDEGRAYGWGANTCGQLGWKDSSGNKYVSDPKSVPLPSPKRVVQISCGQKHTLMILSDGSVYAMGDNSFGQLGIGNCQQVTKPTEILSLHGRLIVQVACGGWHSLCVTVSGKVLAWGRNDFGQLGLGDTKDRNMPCLLETLKLDTVRYIDAGDYHTAILTEDGGVFTFGSSDKGQLGHEESKTELNPRKINELDDSTVTQIGCGKRHTIAFVPSCSQIFACGSGARGQLGQGCKMDSLTVPTIVKGPWQFKSADTPSNFRQLVVGGNQSFAILCSTSEESSMDFRNTYSQRIIWSITPTLCEIVSTIIFDSQISQIIIAQLECVMSSQNCINMSFLAEDHHRTNDEYSGLNMTKMRELFSKIMQCKNKSLLQKIENSLSRNLLPSMTSDPLDTEALRLYIVLPELELLQDPGCYESLLFPFVEKFLHLSENCMKILDHWYHNLDSDFFLTPIKMCQNCIINTVIKELPQGKTKSKITLLLKFMHKLNAINDSCVTSIVDFREFNIPELNDLVRIDVDYQLWSRNPRLEFSFCQYPFVLNTKVKTELLRTDATQQMTNASHQAAIQNEAFFCLRSVTGIAMPDTGLQSSVLLVEVDRKFLVRDTLKNISDIENLKRPFRVKFVGEKGLDYGAVRKEYFRLILKELLDPKYGLFHRDENSQVLWFSDYKPNRDKIYRLIGTLCGLAVYNSEIININFPLVMYKKLLEAKPTLSDLMELDPVLARKFQKMVESGEEPIDLMFTISCNISGKRRDMNLVQNGANIPVTSKNADQYVEAYIDYIFNRSVEFQFESFKEGFLKVCGGEALKLFRPKELREMFVGIENYDWEELREYTEYEGEFCVGHQVIIWFWEVFFSMTADEKDKFVCFYTGASKIPIEGLRLTIRPLVISDPLPPVDDYLPVARACFNILELPQYSTKKALEEKLKLAIKEEGFHLL